MKKGLLVQERATGTLWLLREGVDGTIHAVPQDVSTVAYAVLTPGEAAARFTPAR